MRALPALGYDLALVTGRSDGTVDPSFRAFLSSLLRDEAPATAPSLSIPTTVPGAGVTTVDDLTIEALSRTIPSCKHHRQLNVHMVESLGDLHQLDIVVDHVCILVAKDDVTGMKKTEFQTCQHLEQIQRYDCWMQRFSVVAFSEGWVPDVPTLGETIPTFVCHTRDPESIRQVARIIRRRTRFQCPLLAITL